MFYYAQMRGFHFLIDNRIIFKYLFYLFMVFSQLDQFYLKGDDESLNFLFHIPRSRVLPASLTRMIHYQFLTFSLSTMSDNKSANTIRKTGKETIYEH